MTIWFTSDTHFAHANIIEYCARPFRDVEEMNTEMVSRWNARVQPDDTVYHLGDFAFGPYENISRFLGQLKGNIHLVRGNHDRSIARMEKCFGEHRVHDELTISMDGDLVWLTHKPRSPEAPTPIVGYHFHGHVHETYARRGNAINVGVDVRGFAPATFEELLRA